MNLLTEDWIPVSLEGVQKRISLEILLTTEKDWKLMSFRDDMELATLQLLVALVQVCFMPKDKTELVGRIEKPLTSDEYHNGVRDFVDWFDLGHPKWPFMQDASVRPKKNEANFTSLHKLFVGLPEKTSSSASSNAFFNRVDEIETAHFGDVAVAMFQQATNGFSLGGSAFSVGLKGGMPLTTLIADDDVRKMIWFNVLTCERFPTEGYNSSPTWVACPQNGIEVATEIGIIRGLFWQPAKIRLKIDCDRVVGFYSDPGLCVAKGFWVHPHTPIDYVRLKNNNPKEKPYQSLSSHRAIWAQMLGFFYILDDLSQDAGYSCAMVVQQFRLYFGGQRPLYLAAGGYIKGGSAESLAWRRHETFTLASGWENRAPEMEVLISIGNRFESALYSSVTRCCHVCFPADKKEDKTMKKPNLKQRMFEYSKREFLKHSEILFHSVLKQADYSDLKRFIGQLQQLTEEIYEETIAALEHDAKYVRGIAEGWRVLRRRVKEIKDGDN